MAEVTAPSVKPSPAELAQARVQIVQQYHRIDYKTGVVTLRVECLTCWRQWPERQTAQGFLNPHYYRCPNGCNR